MSAGRARALLALKRLRGEIAKRRELKLGRVAQCLLQAETAVAQVTEQCQVQRQRLEAARASDPSPQPARDAQAARRWQERLQAELVALEKDRETALQEAREQRAACSAAQQALARARADLQVVERAWEKWDQARRDLEQRRAEEELADLAAARRVNASRVRHRRPGER